MTSRIIVSVALLLVASCAAEPTPTPDLVATEVSVQKAAASTLAAKASRPTPLPALTPKPTAAAEPMATRPVADDDTWYECWWQATELWVDAGGAFERALQLVEDNPNDGCRLAAEIADQLYDVKADWDRCPLPSSPLAQEFDSLSREALSNEGLASMYFLLWCETGGQEAWDIMMHFRSESARLAQEAQDQLNEAN